jgi:hypothetical protein
MTIDIIVAPDIYYRNWDTPRGEMWLILRPMIYTGRQSEANPLGDKLAEFMKWASDPHKSLIDNDPKRPRYQFVSPHKLNLGSGRCQPGECYLPIVLPSDIDLEIQIGRGTEAVQTIRVPRTSGCKVVPGEKETVDAFADPRSATPQPYAWLFNENTCSQLKTYPPDDPRLVQAIFYWQQQMEAGRRLRFMAGRVLDAYDRHDVPMPVLEDEVSPAGPITNLYWFLGQMIRIGTQAELARIKAIDRLDILFKVNNTVVDLIPFPDNHVGKESAQDYFSKVGDGFSRSLECQIDDREHRIYVSPGFRMVQPDDTLRGRNIWVIERPADREIVAATIPPQLCRLGAVEFRGALSPAPHKSDIPSERLQSIGGTIAFIPGLLVKGALRSYRRYPMLKAPIGGKLKQFTVLEFVPDPSVARELESLRNGLDATSFAQLFDESVSEWSRSEWKFSLLHAGALPWDGPQTKYRIAAEPRKGAYAAAGEPMMCEEPSLTLFIAPFHKEIDAIVASAVDSRRSLWRGDAGTNAATSAAQLAEQWERRVGTVWAKLEFNALRLFGLTSPAETAVAVSLMMLDEFTLNAANSPVRLERVLSTLAISPRTASLSQITDPKDPRNFDPLRDYEDDYVNQNSALITFSSDGQGSEPIILGPKVLRTPMRTEIEPDNRKICNVNRRQTIPLLHSWASDPLNRPQDEWRNEVFPDRVRAETALRYELLANPEAGPYEILLEHTYGDRLSAAKNGTKVSFVRSTRRDWPVQLPMAVEHRDGTIKRFVDCSFEAGMPDRVRLRFDLSFLTFDAIKTAIFKPGDYAPSDTDKQRRRQYADAVAAWSALAELASPKAIVRLTLRRAVFDLNQGFSKLASPIAASLACNGFPDGWAGGIGEIEPIILQDSAVSELRNWAKSLVTSPLGSGALGKREFVISLSPGDKLGETAHLMQIELEVRRDPMQAPATIASQVMVPISQQPGLYQVRRDTMQETWAGLGFGPKLSALDFAAAGPVWGALQGAQREWTQLRTKHCASIAPPENPAKASDPATAADRLRAALIAHLKGTHWFAPSGAGPRPSKKAVQPLLVPLGFAPCRPHVALKGLTQVALHRVSTALADAIDLAYLDWSQRGAAFYRPLFDRLAGLASTDGESWTGPLPAFAKLLTERLLFPEPDIHDAGNDPAIRDIAKAIRESQGDLAHLGLAVQRQLIRDPSSFAQAKALLLTQLRFADDPTAGPTPHPLALAGARFMRHTGNRADPKSVPTTVNVGLAELVLTGASAGAGFDERLGFLELLDDAAYGDVFDVPPVAGAATPTDFVVESYEDKIDPGPSKLAWKQRAPVLPLAAANVTGAARHPVHLASRALVVAPQVQPIDHIDTLERDLRSPNAPAMEWGLEDLRKGKSGYGGSGPWLSMIARRAREVTAADSIEQGIAYVLYTVTGDEEQSRSLLSSFENDSFFLELTEGSYMIGQPQTLVSDASAATIEAERWLRELAFAERGSTKAAAAIEKLAFPSRGVDFSLALEDFVWPSCAELPGKNSALLRIEGDSALAPIRDYGNAAQGTRNRLHEVALFGWMKDADLSGPRTCYLLIGFETSVWRPVEAHLSQGRNVPEARWVGQADPLDTPRFAPEFWQSAAQDGAATRHVLTNRAKANQPSDWHKPGHVIRLDANWRNPRTAKELVERLLFTPGVAIGDYHPTGGILHPSSRSLIFSQELSVQVYHQQFEDDPTEPQALPISAIATPIYAAIPANPANEPLAQNWFDPRYDHFSVDFRWFAPNGTSLLSLTNVFVSFA